MVQFPDLVFRGHWRESRRINTGAVRSRVKVFGYELAKT